MKFSDFFSCIQQ